MPLSNDYCAGCGTQLQIGVDHRCIINNGKVGVFLNIVQGTHMKSLFEQQGDFFRATESATPESHGLDYCCNLAETLIEEEVINETLPALRKYQTNPSMENLAELADGIVDSVYVLLDAANRFDIPFDLLWDEVHRSNMRKINPDGTVTRNKDGKVMKPPGFTPPDVFGILLEHQTKRQYGEKYMTKGMVS